MQSKLDVAAARARIDAALQELGYIIKLVKPHRDHTDAWSATHKENGVQFRFEALDPTKIEKEKWSYVPPAKIMIECKLRDERGRMLTHNFSFYGIHDDAEVDQHLPELLTLQGKTVTAPRITTKAALFPPLRFSADMIGEHQQNWKGGVLWITLKNVYRCCRVKGIAILQDDLRISLDGTYKPGEQCWFYIIGETANRESKASPEIIVSEIDGDLVYYPVRSNRVTDDLQPRNTYVDYAAFTELDRVLIEKAIESYLQGLLA